jgi:hypothetical protein
VKVVGLLNAEENAPDGGFRDQANVYVGANRAGHFERSESSENCGPDVDTAVSVQSSIGFAPGAWSAPMAARTGFAPQESAVNVLWPVCAFPIESVAVTDRLYAPPGVLTMNHGVCVVAPFRAGGFTGESVQAYANEVLPGEKQTDDPVAVSVKVSSRKN